MQRHACQALLPQLDWLVGGFDAVPRSVDSLALHVYFGHVDDAALSQLARKAFELFRCVARHAFFIRALTEFTSRR